MKNFQNFQKITLFALSAFVFFFSFSFSQEVNVYWGQESPLDRFSTPQLLGKRGDVLFGYKNSSKGLSLLKYSIKDLQVKNEYPLMGSTSKGNNKVIDMRDYTLNDLFILKSKMYISVSKYDRKKDLNSIYLQEIDESGRLTGNLKKLADISAKSRSNSGSFVLYSSADSSKLLLVNNPPFEKYAGEKFSFKIFDENLKELNNLEIALPYKDKNFSVSDYIISNDGVIYMLAQIEIDKKEKKEKQKQKGKKEAEAEESDSYYEIISVNPSGKGKVTEYEIKLPGKDITDVSYRLDEDNGKGIICAGFYGNIEVKGRSHNDLNGVFYLRLNKETKEIEAKGIKEFDKDFIAELTSARKANKGRGISGTFELKDFVKISNGGAILVAENSYMYTVTTYTRDPKTGMVTGTKTTYHYIRNNIIAININPDGSIKWYANIPKYQHTTDDKGAFSSFMLASHENKMYFIYNDNPKNLDPVKVKTVKDMRTMTSPKAATVVMVELTESGEFTKKALFSNKENKMTFIPLSSIKTGANEYIVTAINPGFWCCVSFKAATTKLARFEFK